MLKGRVISHRVLIFHLISISQAQTIYKHSSFYFILLYVFQIDSPYTVQSDLVLETSLPTPPEYQSYRSELPHGLPLVYVQYMCMCACVCVCAYACAHVHL